MRQLDRDRSERVERKGREAKTERERKTEKKGQGVSGFLDGLAR